jgi:hypothetical protein
LALGVWGKAPNSENQNAQAFWFGILPPPFGRNPASLPALALGVWGKAPNSENQNAQAFWFGIHAGHPRRITT